MLSLKTRIYYRIYMLVPYGFLVGWNETKARFICDALRLDSQLRYEAKLKKS